MDSTLSNYLYCVCPIQFLSYKLFLWHVSGMIDSIPLLAASSQRIFHLQFESDGNYGFALIQSDHHNILCGDMQWSND